jgi:hypothetical protein
MNIISKNSWHYKYWIWIRGIWGLSKPPETASICFYCQTMFWLTIITFLMSPILALSWFSMKGLRLAYKFFETINSTHKLVDAVDSLDWCCGYLDWCGEEIEKKPALVLFLNTCAIILTIVGALMILGALYYLGYGLLYLPMAVYSLIWIVVVGVAYCGWLVIYLCSYIGALEATVGNFLIWLFTNGSFWYIVGYWCLLIGAILLVVAAIAWGVVYSVYKLANSDRGKAIKRFVALYLNGYQEARQQAMDRRAKEKEEKLERRMAIERGEYKESLFEKAWNILGWLWSCIVLFWLGIGWLVTKSYEALENFFVSKKLKTGETKVSPFAIIVKYLISFKKQICPLIKFVDETESEETESEETESEETESKEPIKEN